MLNILKPKPIMKKNLPLAILLTLVLAIVFPGCAAMEASNTEKLLSAAGFQPRTPTTAAQQEIYEAMRPYKIEKHMVKGKMLYAYADKKQGVVYIGGESEYQRYARMSVQQEIAQTNLATAQINQVNSMNWDAWGPSGMGW